jgi:hypothetical protein
VGDSALKSTHQIRTFRDDGVETNSFGLPAPGPRGIFILFAVMVVVVAVPALLLALFGNKEGHGVAAALGVAALIFVAAGAYAVRDRRAQLERDRRTNPPN